MSKIKKYDGLYTVLYVVAWVMIGVLGMDILVAVLWSFADFLEVVTLVLLGPLGFPLLPLLEIFLIIGVIIYDIVIIAGAGVILLLYMLRVFSSLMEKKVYRGLALETSIYAGLLFFVFPLTWWGGAVMGAIAGISWFLVINDPAAARSKRVKLKVL